jgi:hypothetical protein
MSNNWPESVPWLTARDITRDFDQTGEIPGTFKWWLVRTFKGRAYGAARAALYTEVCEVNPGLGILTIHMSKLATKSRMAKMWNAAMKSLGYSEVQDA